MRRFIIIIAFATVFFTGCTSYGGAVEELLAAPRMSDAQKEIQAVIAQHAGTSYKLKYPQRGVLLSPFVFEDLDGDGVDEALAFFSNDIDSKNVRMALLKYIDNEWKLIADIEGEGTDVDSITITKEGSTGKPNLLVGYSNINSKAKHLEVYYYNEDVLYEIYYQQYLDYVVGDFTQTGNDDIVVISPPLNNEKIKANLVTLNGEKPAMVSIIDLDSRIQGVKSIYTRENDLGTAIIMDVVTVDGYATQTMYCQENKLVMFSDIIGMDIIKTTSRTQEKLKTSDMNGDKNVETPVVLSNISDKGGEIRWNKVSYYDFVDKDTNVEEYTGQADSTAGLLEEYTHQASSSNSVPQAINQGERVAQTRDVFGIADTDYNFFVRLPNSMKNSVDVKYIDDKNWCIVKKELTEKPLITFQILDKNDKLSEATELYGNKNKYKQAAATGSHRIFVRVEEMSGINPSAIIENIKILS